MQIKSTFTTGHPKLRAAARATESAARFQIEAIDARIRMAKIERELVDQPEGAQMLDRVAMDHGSQIVNEEVDKRLKKQQNRIDGQTCAVLPASLAIRCFKF